MVIFPADVHKACRVILDNALIVDPALEYALPYARKALSLTGSKLEVAAGMVLINTQYWKHHNAKQIRDVLRGFRAT